MLARVPALQVISVITLATGLELSNDLLNPILISPDPHLARQSTAISNPLGFHMVPPSGEKKWDEWIVAELVLLDMSCYEHVCV